jgi:hypothetical protein
MRGIGIDGGYADKIKTFFKKYVVKYIPYPWPVLVRAVINEPSRSISKKKNLFSN